MALLYTSGLCYQKLPVEETNRRKEKNSDPINSQQIGRKVKSVPKTIPDYRKNVKNADGMNIK